MTSKNTTPIYGFPQPTLNDYYDVEEYKDGWMKTEIELSALESIIKDAVDKVYSIQDDNRLTVQDIALKADKTELIPIKNKNSMQDVELRILTNSVESNRTALNTLRKDLEQIGNISNNPTIDLSELTALRTNTSGVTFPDANSRLENDIGSLMGLIEEAQANIETALDSVEYVRLAIDTVYEEMQNIEAVEEELKNKVDDVIDTVDTVKRNLRTLSDEHALLDTKVTGIDTKVNTANSNITTLQNKVQVAENKADVVGVDLKVTETEVATIKNTLLQYAPDIENAVKHVYDTARQDQYGQGARNLFAENAYPLDNGKSNRAKWTDTSGYIHWYVSSNFSVNNKNGTIILNLPVVPTINHQISMIDVPCLIYKDGNLITNIVGVANASGTVVFNPPPGGWGTINAIRIDLGYEAY